MKRVLLVGAGHAHLAMLRQFAEEPLYGARLGLVSPRAKQLYSAMLPGIVAGHYRLQDAEIDVAKVAARSAVEFHEGSVVGLDLARRVARLADGTEIDYDYASINAGALVDDSLPGAREHALAVKPFDGFLQQLGSPKRLALAGAGVSGAELAMALRHAGAQVTLYSDKATLSPVLAARLVPVLRRRGVDYRPGMPVTEIHPGPVVISGRSRQEFDRVLLATGAVALPWLKRSGLATDAQGFALVHGTLQSVSHPEVFVAGDCATLRDSPHPKSGVYAVRHGELLAQNLRNLVQTKPFLSYHPQPKALALITCGARFAVAEYGDWTAQGHWVWWWKDRIDRRWIKGLNG